MSFTRRQLFQAAGFVGLVAAASPVMAAASRWPKKPSVPTDLNAEEFFTELAEKGTGFVVGNEKSDTVVMMTFDPQCRWCAWQYDQFLPFLERVKFVWHPVAVLNPWSEPQGAAILSAADPKAAFEENESRMKEEFKGIDVRGKEFTFEKRDAVWTNTKIHRRSGAREVPFGVMKKANGEYVAVCEQTGDDFKKLLG